MFYRPEIETADLETLREHQRRRLNDYLAFVREHNRFYQAKYREVPPGPLASFDEMRSLPFTTKRELVADQLEYPPLGTMHTFPLSAYSEYHQTSGTTGRPLKVLDTPEDWVWWRECWGYIYNAAGISREDVQFLAFSFGPFIGFWGAYAGAQALGILTIPGGGQDSIQRLTLMRDIQATVLVCTPTYALRLAEVAAEEGFDLGQIPLRIALQSGEPGASIPSTRRRIEEVWGVTAHDHAGASEMGAWGFSCSEQRGVHVNEAEYIAEVLDPESGRPVMEGETGELVLSNLGRKGLPNLRYRTGDLVRHGGRTCGCGRTFLMLEGGIIGRADDMAIIRGVNIYPSALESIVRGFPAVQEYKILLWTDHGNDELELQVETAEPGLAEKIAQEIRVRLGLRVTVGAVPPGALPRFELKARRLEDRREARR